MASASESTASQGIVSVPDASHPVSDPPTISHPMLSSSPQPRPVTALQSQSNAARATPLHARIRSVSDLTAMTPHQHQAGHDSRHEEATPPLQESQASSHTASQSFSGPVGYLANRWNLGSSFSTPSTQGSARDEFTRYESKFSHYQLYCHGPQPRETEKELPKLTRLLGPISSHRHRVLLKLLKHRASPSHSSDLHYRLKDRLS